jgi:hypothetical protein
MLRIGSLFVLAVLSFFSFNSYAGLVEVIEPNRNAPDRPTVFVDYWGGVNARVIPERDQDRRSFLVQSKAVTYVSLRPHFKFRLDFRSSAFNMEMKEISDLHISMYIEPSTYKKAFPTLDQLLEHLTNIIRETGNMCFQVEAREVPAKDVGYLNDAKLENPSLIHLNFYAGEDGKTLLRKFNSKIMRLFFQAPADVTHHIDNLFDVGHIRGGQ